MDPRALVGARVRVCSMTYRIADYNVRTREYKLENTRKESNMKGELLPYRTLYGWLNDASLRGRVELVES